MNSYNGFTPTQRSRAQAWLNEQWGTEQLARPTLCCVCGQDHGVVDAHAEDYSEPFGPHISKYPLCYPCHMILHCRFKSPDAFRRYVTAVEQGLRTMAYYRRDWGRFTKECLDNPRESPFVVYPLSPLGTVTFAAIIKDGASVKRELAKAGKVRTQ